MIGDLFTVSTIVAGQKTNRYSHATLYKTLIDYLDRLSKARLVVVDVELNYIGSALLTNPFLFCTHLRANCSKEIKLQGQCQELISIIEAFPSTAYIMGYWSDSRNSIICNPDQARAELKRSDWQSMVVVMYPADALPNYRVACSNKSECLTAVNLWEQEEQKLRMRHAVCV